MVVSPLFHGFRELGDDQHQVGRRILPIDVEAFGVSRLLRLLNQLFKGPIGLFSRLVGHHVSPSVLNPFYGWNLLWMFQVSDFIDEIGEFDEFLRRVASR